MSLLTLGILIFFLALVLFCLYFKKYRQSTVNRYHRYRASQSKKKTIVRPNRYHKAHGEPDAGSKSSDQCEVMPKEGVVDSFDLKQADHAFRNEKASQPHHADTVLMHSLKTPSSNEASSQTVRSSLRPPLLIIFHILSEEERPFNGYELLQALLSLGMRYGKYQIFHRHEEKTGKGRILFSLASMTKPGTFDLPRMGGFSTPGLSVFFNAADVEDPLMVYELMLQTAGDIVSDLGGLVLDSDRKTLISSTVVAQRKQLREYQEKQQTFNLFDATTEAR